MNVRIAFVVIVCAGVLTWIATPSRAIGAPVEAGQGARPSVDPNLCLDEAGRAYSKNSFRKVNAQIQVCRGRGRWELSDAAPATRTRDCSDERRQVYQSGLFRKSGTTFQRCDSGTWRAIESSKIEKKGGE